LISFTSTVSVNAIRIPALKLPLPSLRSRLAISGGSDMLYLWTGELPIIGRLIFFIASWLHNGYTFVKGKMASPDQRPAIQADIFGQSVQLSELVSKIPQRDARHYP